MTLDSEQNGVKLTKTYVFKRGDYTIDINHAVTNNSGVTVTLGALSTARKAGHFTGQNLPSQPPHQTG